jgi:hypothetical protein
VKDMDKNSKSHFHQTLTRRSLIALLVLSFICTVLGFAVAYNEHRNLSVLSDKYNQAIDKIESCEAAISEMSEKIAHLQTTSYNKHPTPSEDFVTDEKGTEDITAPTTGRENITASQAADSKYYVTQSGTKYHTAHCSYLSKSRIPVSLETIKSKGYSPCSRCIK